MNSDDIIKEMELKWKQAVKWFEFGGDERLIQERIVQLEQLWRKAQPMDKSCLSIVQQITSLSVCNWNLEQILPSLFEAIGKKEPSKLRIGHRYSITDERWRKVWAYYLTLKDWLQTRGYAGSRIVMLHICDPDETVQKHIQEMLGERDKLKELYVERFCHFFEYHLLGFYPEDSAQLIAHKAAILALEEEIRKMDYEENILNALQVDPTGELHRYEPCHHKFFRRCDITLSSIGVGKWRGAIPIRGTDKEDLQKMLAGYRKALDNWLSNEDKEKDNELSHQISKLLGKTDDTKIFLASLLHSFLKGQEG